MILAAGLGTRLKTLTANKPKALVEIEGVTMLEHQINYLTYNGIEEIIINVHHYADKIIDFLKSRKWNAKIVVSDESDLLLDTGGGLVKASWFFDNNQPFVVTAVDVFTYARLSEIIKFHQKTKPLATLLVNERESNRYLLCNEDNILCGWESVAPEKIMITRKVNKNDIYRYAFCAIHIIDPVIFDHKPENEIFSITSWYLELSRLYDIILYPVRAEWYEMGRIENFDNEKIIKGIKRIIDFYKKDK